MPLAHRAAQRLTNYRVIDESGNYLPESSSAAALALSGRDAIPGPHALQIRPDE